MTAAKLVHTLVGLLGHCRDRRRRLAGSRPLQASRVPAQRLAAVVAAAIFATMPLVLWELGTAYVDLFPVLFAMAVVLGRLAAGSGMGAGVAVVAGALAGFGLAAKLTMGLVIVAVVAALALVGRGSLAVARALVSPARLRLGRAGGGALAAYAATESPGSSRGQACWSTTPWHRDQRIWPPSDSAVLPSTSSAFPGN